MLVQRAAKVSVPAELPMISSLLNSRKDERGRQQWLRERVSSQFPFKEPSADVPAISIHFHLIGQLVHKVAIYAGIFSQEEHQGDCNQERMNAANASRV